MVSALFAPSSPKRVKLIRTSSRPSLHLFRACKIFERAMAVPFQVSRDGGVSTQQMVFACGMCQATIAEVYATKDSNSGFDSNSGESDGVVTRMWIAECSHIVCGKHLEGGG